MPSPRTLKPGPRGFIVFGIILALLLALLLSMGGSKAQWTDTAEMAGCLIGVFALVGLSLASNRIMIDADRIAFRRGFTTSPQVYFRDINFSEPQVLLERDWPLSLTIYCGENEQPNLTIPLKPFRQADVTWLLSLPELKVRWPDEA